SGIQTSIGRPRYRPSSHSGATTVTGVSTSSSRIEWLRTSVAAELRLPQAMADDHAATRRELEDIGKLRRDGGDGHDRPDVRDHDLGFRLAGRAELLENVAAGSKGQGFFARGR